MNRREVLRALTAVPITRGLSGIRKKQGEADGEITLVLFNGEVEVARKSRPFKFKITACASDIPHAIRIGPVDKEVTYSRLRAYADGKEIHSMSCQGRLWPGDVLTLNIKNYAITLI